MQIEKIYVSAPDENGLQTAAKLKMVNDLFRLQMSAFVGWPSGQRFVSDQGISVGLKANPQKTNNNPQQIHLRLFCFYLRSFA
ncbi:MAG: hypothetical protein HYZ31_08790 [Gammaproteobacteria bacterium]|nr:hypothetical protein [Gammaproteobacteria bacterium]